MAISSVHHQRNASLRFARKCGTRLNAPNNFVQMHNTHTNETGRLTIEDSESRFNYMIVTDGGGHEEGYWQAHEWQRNGWTEAEPID